MARRPIPGVGAHARDRMAERMGRDLTREEWLAAVAAIVERRAVLLGVMPNGSEHYWHEVGGVPVRLVWRPEWALVATVLPIEMPAARRVAEAKGSPVRQTLRVCAKFVRGKRMPARTCWVPPEDR